MVKAILVALVGLPLMWLGQLFWPEVWE